MTVNRYGWHELDAMCDYQLALQRLDELEDELMLCDFTDSRRYEIDREITQLEAWIEDLLSRTTGTDEA